MKRRTDKFLIGSCLLVFTGILFYMVYIFAIQEGISRGKALGAEETVQLVPSCVEFDGYKCLRMAMLPVGTFGAGHIPEETEYPLEQLEQQLQEVTRIKNDYSYELSRCRDWVDLLGADITEARAIIRGMR